jgi:serine/threonine protein kinase SCH9
MATANTDQSTSRSDSDGQDHIGSSQPGSGVATPRPDPSDKRTPGIMHGFFHQVGRTFSRSASLRSPLASSPMDAGMDAGLQSLSLEDREDNMVGPSHVTWDDEKAQVQTSGVQSDPYPTPPMSSRTSWLGKSEDLGTGETSSGGEARATRLSRAESRPPSRDLTPPKTRNNSTFALPRPPSTIVTDSNVFASMSNPAATSLASPTSKSIPTTPVSESPSFLKLQELTNVSAKKATPPHTPRGTTSAGSTVPDTRQPPPGPARNPTQDSMISRGPSPDSAHLAKVGPPKGKLTVKILEARGLRQCNDPYVVCVFEWNEYISKGPRRSNDDMDDDEDSKDNGGVPIGIPMSTPMRSRQSSQIGTDASRPDGSSPLWNHEAIL